MADYINHGGLTYRVCHKLPPAGYQRWNIGKHAPKGYVPFARLKMRQPFDGCTEVDTNDLLAIPEDIYKRLTHQKGEWVKTDDTQYIRQTGPDVYEAAQVVELPEDYAVYHGHIYLTDYTEEEKNDILAAYDYPTWPEMVREYGKDIAGQLFAEFAFETEFVEFSSSFYNTLDEAVAEVEKIIRKEQTA